MKRNQQQVIRQADGEPEQVPRGAQRDIGDAYHHWLIRKGLAHSSPLEGKINAKSEGSEGEQNGDN